MSKRVGIFSGTSDGSKLSLQLAQRGFEVTVCTATEYGEACSAKHEHICVQSGRMDLGQMTAFLGQSDFVAVVDATHPYAVEVSENISGACKQLQLPYYRLVRSAQSYTNVVEVENVDQAAAFLNTTTGNVLVTTGSKELEAFTQVKDYQNRLYARVLSTVDSVEKCRALGFEGKNLIAMQGPFGEELNVAMLHQIQAKWMVTKQSGMAGGFEEKYTAAQKANAGLVVISRPRAEQGYCAAELVQMLTGSPMDKTVYLVGIGMGSSSGMTQEAVQAMEKAELIIGADRMLAAVKQFAKPVIREYRTQQILSHILNSDQSCIAVALSGDIGFYSGAKQLLDQLQAHPQIAVHPVCGISSVVYLCSKLGLAWEDAVLVSMHGRKSNLAFQVRHNPKVFAITGKNTAMLLQQLCEDGLADVQVAIGSDLSYETEHILRGTAQQLKEMPIPALCAMLLQNPHAQQQCVVPGVPDEAFLRGKVPMTKEEVRAISLCKLQLTRQAVVYDVGAGTGSISVEAALMAGDGWVYAVERNEEACALIKDNCRKFGTDNVTLVPGYAPEALQDLPAPTHVFIGGSGGNMAQIVACVLEKNPHARIVINTIAMESTMEAMALIQTLPVTQVDIAVVNVAKSKAVGPYHMMMGSNPVTIFSFTGNGAVR